jgi:protocatechuate 3,4-dioxygenase beta subunit
MTKNDSWGQILHEPKNWQPDPSKACHQEEQDLYTLSRREMLALMGTLLTAALAGWRREWTALSTASAADLPSCVVRPEQTEGPYFIDEKLNRSDIRSDPSDGSIKPGAPLRLAFQVSRIDGRSCEPLPNAVVDIWHCDALGMYSDVRDQGFDTRGKKFLRGYQTTDANGVVEFLTIYPGWYAGRAVHIHFKIRTASMSRRAHEFTSQLYFDESVTDKVHGQAPYVSKGRRNTPNDKDFIFRQNGKQLMPVLTKEAQGYAAKFDIGLKIT